MATKKRKTNPKTALANSMAAAMASVISEAKVDRGNSVSLQDGSHVSFWEDYGSTTLVQIFAAGPGPMGSVDPGHPWGAIEPTVLATVKAFAPQFQRLGRVSVHTPNKEVHVSIEIPNENLDAAKGALISAAKVMGQQVDRDLKKLNLPKSYRTGASSVKNPRRRKVAKDPKRVADERMKFKAIGRRMGSKANPKWTATHMGHAYEIQGHPDRGFRVLRDGVARFRSIDTLHQAKQVANDIAEFDRVGNPRKTKKKTVPNRKTAKRNPSKKPSHRVLQPHEVPAKTKKRILGKLDRGESLSTKDFEDMGYPFEYFLRYGNLSAAKTKEAHAALRKMFQSKPQKNPKDKDGWYVEVTYPHSASTQKIYIANPGGWSWHAEGATRSRKREEGLYVFQFGAYGWTQVAVWEDSFQSAWDEAGDWLRDHAPGVLVNNKDQQELMEEAAEEKGHKLKDLSWDTDNELLSQISEEALVDLAPIGGHGDYIASYEAHGSEMDPSTPLYKKILVESVRAEVDEEGDLDEDEAEQYQKALAATRNPRRKGKKTKGKKTKAKKRKNPGTKTVKGVRSLVSGALK